MYSRRPLVDICHKSGRGMMKYTVCISMLLRPERVDFFYYHYTHCMPITKSKKEELLNEFNDVVASSASVVFAQFKGLNAEESNELRGTMRDAEVSYKVAKKTLLKRALDESSITGDAPELEGEIAIAWGSDLIAPARETQKFNKAFAGKITIMGGIFEGRFMNQDEMVEIATIPDVPVLRGMFVNVINSPIQGLAVALQAIADKKEA